MNLRPPVRMLRADRVIEELLGPRPPVEGQAFRDVRRLWREQLAPRRASLLVAVALTVIGGLTSYGFALTWRFAVDRVMPGATPIPATEVSRHARLALVFFLTNMAIWTVHLICQWTRQRMIVGIGQGLVYRLRKDLHRKLQALHVGFFERTPVGVIVSRVLDDVNVILEWVTGQALTAVASVGQIIVGFVLLFSFEWRLTLLLMLTLPLYAAAFVRLRPAISRANRAMRALNARMYGRSTERLGAVQLISVFGRERAEAQAFANLVHDSVRVSMRLVGYGQGLALAAGIVSAAGMGGIVFCGASMVRAGHLTLGTLVGFTASLGAVFGAVSNITMIATELQGALVVLRRVFRVLDEAEDVAPGRISLDGMAGRIVFDRVTFRYPRQSRPAIEEVSFAIRPGERVALMGPSGSGKSTIFQLLLRFYDPDGGRIAVGGVELDEADPVSIRSHIRLVQQEPTIFSGTLEENIRYGRLDATPAEVEQAARLAELHEFIAALPEGYETDVGEGGITLSGGQKQRLALAAALLTSPEVLLLDDTTSALDAVTEARLRETLARVSQGRTDVVITQRVATAQGCDRILVFEHGRLTQEGTHTELAHRPGFYRDICLQQESIDADAETGAGQA